MGDRTYYRLSLPAGLDREAIRMAAIAFTNDSWTDTDVARLLDPPDLDRTVRIDIQERYVGECREAAEAVLTALREHGADVAFTVSEDPKYEWLGTLCRYQPGKGVHEVDCDASENALLTDQAFRRLCNDTEPATALARIRDHLGVAWQSAPTG